ncbi:hypothetical protein AZI87_02950 [Bdellovibrio bacteriovorus]|uniref:Uncharacterized protein n=1 Tax=Bdellovibrio bacteriovorus TaxID=959 RepID=A0A162GIG5_BDEBC|nr:hypothetical protein [Bdellovibrio bacteriovorus]KYG68230.1 hypothetical protein AZI87_02950 [Bdellovibrio bacteriovorus]
MMKLLLFASLIFSSVMASANDVTALTVEPGKQQDQYYSYNFGSTWVNSRMYADFSLTAGDQQVDLQGISIRGQAYDATSNCPKVLPPRQTCWTRVFFWPQFEGHYYGDLMFYLKNSTIYIRLYGWAHR